MIVLDLIKKASNMLDEINTISGQDIDIDVLYETLIDDIEDIDDVNNQLIEVYPALEKYINSINLLICELFSKYIHIYESVELTSTEKIIAKSKLSDDILIKSIYDSKNRLVRYIIEDDNIVFQKDDIYKIKYIHLPKIDNLYSCVDGILSYFTIDTILYGILQSYCFMVGRYVEYNSYRELFENCLPNKILEKSFDIPSRIWS